MGSSAHEAVRAGDGHPEGDAFERERLPVGTARGEGFFHRTFAADHERGAVAEVAEVGEALAWGGPPHDGDEAVFTGLKREFMSLVEPVVVVAALGSESVAFPVDEERVALVRGDVKTDFRGGLERENAPECAGVRGGAVPSRVFDPFA